MLIQVFVAIAKKGDEVLVLGAGTNARLVGIQRDSFMMGEDHIDYESQTQTHELKIEWQEKEKKEKKKDGNK